MANNTKQQVAQAEKEQPKRYKKFGFEVYEDSCPEFDKLARDTKMQMLASPWHDSDVKEDGSLKKKHRHIFVNLGQSNWSVKQIMDFVAKFGAQHFEEIISNRGYIRYMIHLDDPDKAQYNKADILAYGGIKWEQHFDDVNKVKAVSTLAEIIKLCKETECYEFCDLIDYILEIEDLESFEYVMNNSYSINAYLRSKFHKSKDNQLKEMKAIKEDAYRILNKVRKKVHTQEITDRLIDKLEEK